MAKGNVIFITPTEALKLRTAHDASELSWAKQMAGFYGCHPLKDNADDFYTFVADVFHAGRISGVREARRGKQYFDTNGEVRAFEKHIGSEVSDKAREIIEAFGDMINNAYAAGVAEGKKGVC